MKYSPKSGLEFQLGGCTGFASTADSGLKSAEVSYLIVDGRRSLSKTTTSDRIFFVHAGPGDFIISKEKHTVKAGDFVVIPKNSPFEYSGKMILVEFLSPAFDPDGEVQLE